jgi:predicted metal-dependent peptidase
MLSDISVARAQLLVREPWLASLVLRLEPVERPGLGTTATDGRRLLFDPEFFGSLSEPERIGILAHEAMHAALWHCDKRRRGGRDNGRWNIAGDHAINLLLSAAGLTLPQGGCCDAEYAGLTTEQIYERLPKTRSHGCGGIIESDEPPTAAEIAEAKISLAQAAHELKRSGRLAGDKSGAWERLLDTVLAPEIDWREVLRDLVHTRLAAGRDDYSWRRPGRHGNAIGIYLPGMVGRAPEKIMLAIDTSGSMGADDLGQAVAIVRDCAEASGAALTIVQADAEICKIEIVGPGDIFMPPTLSGGGGTDFRPVQRLAKERGEPLLIYISDMEGPMLAADERGGVDTVWITRSDNSATEKIVKIGDKK